MRRVLAVAQTVPIPGDVAANVEQHVRLAHAAASAKAQVLVFPELSLTGYELGLARGLAFAERDRRLGPLLEAAASHSMILIAGAPVEVEARLHIGALILYPDGAVHVYTKHHLGAFSSSASRDGVVPPAEATVFHPGDRSPLVRLGDSTAGLAVCADTVRPAHPRQAAERGAKAYLTSMFVIPSELERETGNLSVYAARHSMTVAFANYGGPSGGLASAGRSAIWSETGELVVRLGESGAGVGVATEDGGRWRARTIML